MKNTILISKDILMKDYLAPYGNKDYITPNISELAEKGTVFNRHYTAAPSTAMAFTSMFTGKYAYETDRKKYTEVDEYSGVTLFDKLNELGYETHVLWDQRYVYLAQRYSKCYGKNTTIHSVDWLTKDIPPHVKGKYDDLTYRPQYTEKLLIEMHKFLESLVSGKSNVFLWIHFPHVLAGRNTYGSDLDVFDTIIGYCREFFDDDCIFITADHGHMNGTHGKYGYGFDVNEKAINIPLIAPKINDSKQIDFPTSNTQLDEIILKHSVVERPYVISETAYYEQPHRKMAIIKGHYKYIYEKQTGRHFIYDLDWDPDENVNFAYPEIYDVDRKRYFAISQRVYYTHWEEALSVLQELEAVKQSIWRNPIWYIDYYEKHKAQLKLFAAKILNK